MGLVETLRRETRADHDAIEAAVGIEGHLVSRDSYRAMLARHYGFHLGFERARDGSPASAGLDPALVPEISRSGLVATDLAALGLDPDEIDRLPVARLCLADRPALLGAIYVMEGSSLGGVLIAKMAAERLGLGPESGTAFFAGDGRDTARRWRACCAALDGDLASADTDAALASARGIFAAMQEWLAPAGSAPAAAPIPDLVAAD